MKRAVYVEGSVEGFRDSIGQWRCYHDGRELAVATSLNRYVWLAWIDLVLLPAKLEGLRVYGLTERSRRRAKSRRGGITDRTVELVDPPPFYVYCPHPGCGRGQRVG